MNRALDLLKRNTTFVLKPLILVLVPLKEHHSECRYIVYGRGGVSNICRSSSQRPRRRSGRSPDRWRVRACGEYSRTPHCLTEVAPVCLMMKEFSLFETPRNFGPEFFAQRVSAPCAKGSHPRELQRRRPP